MGVYSDQSIAKLQTCCLELQETFLEVVKDFDNTILCGERGEQAQNHAVATGASKTPFPLSKHNSHPSKAVDAEPYPRIVDKYYRERLCYFAGFVMATGAKLGYKITWGRDWDNDRDLSDQTFNDYYHFQYEGRL
jgi:hypothetical protein